MIIAAAGIGGAFIAFIVGYFKGKSAERAKNLEVTLNDGLEKKEKMASYRRDTDASDARKWMHDNASSN
jgi:hypothetical protein